MQTSPHADTTGPTASNAAAHESTVRWVLCGLLAAALFAAGGAKLVGHPTTVWEFDQIGLGQWLRYFTGTLEVSGAVGLLVPRLQRWAAALLGVVMIGATVANVAVLHWPPGVPGVLLVLAAAIVWLRPILRALASMRARGESRAP